MGFITSVMVAFLLFFVRKSGVDSERKKHAIAKADAALDEAQRWANRPAGRDDTIKRLRELADDRD